MKTTDSGQAQTQDCGFFLLDLRNVPHEEEESESWQQRWQVSQSQSRSQQLQQSIKVNQLHGVSVLISAVLLTHSTHPSTHALDSHSHPHSHRHNRSNKPDDVRASSASSVSQAASVIALPPRYDLEAHPGSSLARYTLSLSLTATRHLQQMVQRYIHSSNSDSSLPHAPLCWFSWSILDITLQSAEFDPSASSSGRNSLEPATDSLFFECSEVAMLNLLEELGAMRVFLCAPGVILGVAEIPLPQQLNHLPFYKEQGWFSLQSLSPEGGGGGAGDRHGGQDPPAVQLAFEVIATEPAEPATGKEMGGQIGQEEETELYSEDEGEYEQDSFQQEDEDEDEKGAGGRMSTQSHPLLLLKGQGKPSTGRANATPEEQQQQEEADAEDEAMKESSRKGGCGCAHR